MVTVDGWVWTEVQELREDGPGWALELVLDLEAGDREAACAILHDAVGAQIEGFRGNLEVFGGWHFEAIAEGVRFYVSTSEVFQEVLPVLLAALDASGFQGTLVVRDTTVSRPPARAPILACRASLRGERLMTGPGEYAWVADPMAVRAFMTGAVELCRWNGATAAYLEARHGDWQRRESVLADSFAWPELELHDNAVRRIYASNGDRFRSVAWARRCDRIVVVFGGEDGGEWWRSMLDDVVALLRSHAAELEYAAVWRGWDVSGALSPNYVRRDWPRRPDGHNATAFDSLVADDAYGIQLLGAGFADRLLTTDPKWTREELAEGRVLLQHEDLEGWFGAPMLNEREPPDKPVPDLLRAAREDLAALLQIPG
ncbi:hypothetical protein [Solirubrobacter soli]|uniref:hypothetical protein n=1 Tax=Solirubrobacter soli TaxID=363832 RepID=UPI0004158034|nr:hypothetical protein [Solirubrobacter soli]